MSTVKANTIEPASGGTVTITGAALTTPALGTPASGTLTNCTGLPASAVSGLLGETSSTAYRGDRGKTAYEHSQLTSGNPHNVTKSDVGLANADNTSDANKPISTAQQTALDLKANKSQSAWIAVSSFLNSWINYGTTPGGYSDAGYFKDEFGIVHLRGFIKDGTVGSVAFNLPTGFRPEFIKVYSASSGGVYATLRVNPNGDVVPYTGLNTYFSLDGVKFRAV